MCAMKRAVLLPHQIMEVKKSTIVPKVGISDNAESTKILNSFIEK